MRLIKPKTMNNIEYLESLLPYKEDELLNKYGERFEKFCAYKGNGIYQWYGMLSTCTRELWLMGVLHREGIKFDIESI